MTTKTKASKPASTAKETAGKGPQTANNGKAVERSGKPLSREDLALHYLSALRQHMIPGVWEKIVAKAKPAPEDAEDLKRSKEVNDLVNCMESLSEEAPDRRSPYTNKEIDSALECMFEEGFQSGLTELLRFYAMIYPTDRRTLFQIAEVAGYVKTSAAMEAFKDKTREKREASGKA